MRGQVFLLAGRPAAQPPPLSLSSGFPRVGRRARRTQHALLAEEFDLFRAETINVERLALDEMLQSLNRLRRTDQAAGAAPSHIHFARLVDLAYRR